LSFSVDAVNRLNDHFVFTPLFSKNKLGG